MRNFLLLWVLLISCVGCMSNAQFKPQLSAQNRLTDLGEEAVFAVRPDGELLAYVKDGLNLLRLSDGYRQRLSYDSPDTLIWSPDGEMLVAAYSGSEQTRLVTFSAGFSAETKVRVAEKLTDFAWVADDRLLAIGQTVDESAEAIGLQVTLLLWDGSYDVERYPLYKGVFPPWASSQLIDRYPIWHAVALSPLKDELIYNRFLDPPGIGGRSEFVLYNLLTKQELTLAGTVDGQIDAVFSADAEQVLLPAGNQWIEQVNPWTGNVNGRWPGIGQNLAGAPHRDLYLIDGGLFSSERLLLKLPENAKGQFSADGSKLFIAWKQQLYLLDDYPLPEEFRYSGLEKVKLQRIRQQRSRGEMTVRDYYQARNNILNP